MKIRDLDMHCGDCTIIEWCGEPFCYAICEDDRFLDLDERVYYLIADGYEYENVEQLGIDEYEQIEDCTEMETAEKCERYYCDKCQFSIPGPDDDCENYAMAKDDWVRHIADYVEAVLNYRTKKRIAKSRDC